ncbi:MAG: hypothetical protein H0W76_06805 [Pyrinomonadaceae bacterium]|nr:hypothetical protein [Pyrinomonadaceae bacterium]
MNFARLVFLVAGIYGIIGLLPQYFMEAKNGRDFPPPITHPEYYYGFLGVALAWQVLFLILSRDVVRYRAMMIPAVVEKIGFGLAVPLLYLQNRVAGAMLVFAAIDLLLAALFAMAYWRTGGVADP